ncbi:MAG: phenylalanine--tRNA ligase subunit beta [[Eubacterium] sulci]|nr:phenylalanine--tRNA ligase subunit beta [[Eubacterium] sulci]
MLVSIDWIKDYVRLDKWPQDKEFCDRMIMSGSNIETISYLGEGIENVKIAKVLSIDKHPDADKLVVCQMDLGKLGKLQIVTGASNLYVGAYVPVAVDGSVVPGPLHGQPKQEGGVKISAGELRGVKSDGMMCGPQELGIADKCAPLVSKDGIWLLSGNYEDKLGENIDEVLGLKDAVVDFEITPNRPDCLSMIGMAREAAATFGGELVYPKTECNTLTEKSSDYIQVEVKSDLCKRYTARVIKDVKIEQSPWWLQKKLIAAGMRPINNIVDITNFVMMEYGQPLHAFDIRSLAGGKIVVDVAEDGSKFTTLDGVERTFDDSMLMINDANGPVAVAGVMGGLDSEIKPDTETVVLESANFVGSSVRQTSKKLGLRTEASARYEKGIDPNLCEEAADRVCALIDELGYGKVLEGSVDIYKSPEHPQVVSARVSRINKVLGTDLSREEMVAILESLEMKVQGTGDEMIVTAPTVRQDILKEVDFVEEIARMYGYDNLPNTLPKLDVKAENSLSWETRRKLRDLLCAMGADEIQTFSFINQKIFDACRIDEESWERDTVDIINPMGEDTAAMRTILTPGMLEVLTRNYSRSVEGVRAFEIGKVFSKNYIQPEGLPDESFDLSIGVYGKDESFFTLKGMVECMFDMMGIKDVSYIAETEYGIYHPGRCARVVKVTEKGEEVELGIMGEVHPDVASNYGIGDKVYCGEFFLDRLIEFSSREIQYSKPPKYPSTSRDIAMVVSESTPVAEIEKVIKEAGTEILRSVKLFDIYRGIQVGAGKKSVAYSLTYRHDDRTLTDVETEEAHAKVVEALKNNLGASIRDN